MFFPDVPVSFSRINGYVMRIANCVVWGLARGEQGMDEPCRAAASAATLFRLLDVDANSSLNSRVRAGDKPKSLKTESTIELGVVWP